MEQPAEVGGVWFTKKQTMWFAFTNHTTTKWVQVRLTRSATTLSIRVCSDMTNIVKYNDYQGSVIFSDGKLIIKILHIDDTIVEECDSASDVQTVFAALVEEYLETCREIGKEPCKPFKGSFNVRVAPSLHRRAAMAAMENGRSLNAWVEDAIERHLSDNRSLITLRALRNSLKAEVGTEIYGTSLSAPRIASIAAMSRLDAVNIVARQDKISDWGDMKVAGNG